MPIYKMRGLGKYGVITDVPAYDLPTEAWSNASNIRFVASRVEKMNGFMPGIGVSTDQRSILSFCQEPETTALVYGTNAVPNATDPNKTDGGHLYRALGGQVPLDITSAKAVASDAKGYLATPEIPWDYTILSNAVVFNNNLDDPQYWIANPVFNPDQKAKTLPGWGSPKHLKPDGTPYSDDPLNMMKNVPVVNWKCERIRAYKNYLMALNMTEPANGLTGNATKYPQRVRWSDVSNVNDVPPNWIDDNVTTDGGFIDLSDCTGNIVDGRALRDSFVIYTDRETYIMQYTGGEFVFGVQKLFPDSGILNANCVCEFEGTNHFVISEDDIFTHDGSTKTSVVTDVIKERLLGDITSINYQATKVFAYPTRKEIWITYVTKSSETGDSDNYACDRAAVFNWRTGTWSFTDLPDAYWLAEVLSPNTDVRSWSNPDQAVLAAPTKIVLDSPIYSLPNDKTFRIDVVYKKGEGLAIADKLLWTSSDPTIADFVVNDLDNSALLVPKVGKTGKITMTVKLAGSTAADLTSSYDVNITAALGQVGDRHQASDDSDIITVNPDGSITYAPDGILDRLQDPNEPIPDRGGAAVAPVGPYRPDQEDDQANTWPDPDGQNGPVNSNQHDRENWEKKGFSFAARSFVGASEDSSFYFMDTGNTQDRYVSTHVTTSKPVIAEITRYGISLQDIEDSLSRHKTLRTIYPLMSGEGTLRWNIGGSNDAYVQPSFRETKTFIIGKDYKVDCFTNYRYLAITIKDEGVGSWSFSGMDLDYFLGGNR